MKTESKIYEQGLEEYPKVGIFIGNLLMLIWIALGTIGCWFLSPRRNSLGIYYCAPHEES